MDQLTDKQITALIEWAKRRMEYEDFQVDNGIQRHANAIHAQRVYTALSSIPALAARVTALEAALRDVCAAAVGVKTDPFPYAYPVCVACGAPEDDDGEPRHMPNCPVAAALKLLDGGA